MLCVVCAAVALLLPAVQCGDVVETSSPPDTSSPPGTTVAPLPEGGMTVAPLPVTVAPLPEGATYAPFVGGAGCWEVLYDKGYIYIYGQRYEGSSHPGSLAEKQAECIELGSACLAVTCASAEECYSHFCRDPPNCDYFDKPGTTMYIQTCALQDVAFKAVQGGMGPVCVSDKIEHKTEAQAQLRCAEQATCTALWQRDTDRGTLFYTLRQHSCDRHVEGNISAITRKTECMWTSRIGRRPMCSESGATGRGAAGTLDEAKQACLGMTGETCVGVVCTGVFSGEALVCTPHVACGHTSRGWLPDNGVVVFTPHCQSPERCLDPCYVTEEKERCVSHCDCTGTDVCSGAGYCYNGASTPCLIGECIFGSRATWFSCYNRSAVALPRDEAEQVCLGMSDCIGYSCRPGSDGVGRCLVVTQDFYDCKGAPEFLVDAGEDGGLEQVPPMEVEFFKRCCGENAATLCPTAWAEHLADIATPHPHYTHAPPPAPPIVTGLATIGGLAVFVAATTVWLAYKKRSDLRAVRDEAPDQGQELLQAEPQDEDDVVLA